jgi:hypothetical protein
LLAAKKKNKKIRWGKIGGKGLAFVDTHIRDVDQLLPRRQRQKIDVFVPTIAGW